MPRFIHDRNGPLWNPVVDRLYMGSTDVSTTIIPIVIDGGGSTISTGVKGYMIVPATCDILGWKILGDQSGSIVIDLWKDTYANFPPLDADSIAGSAFPTVSAAVKAASTTLTGWTTRISNGDILGWNVDSVTSFTRVTLALDVRIV